MALQAFCDIEPIYTYEGTYDINTLVTGREVTGIASFKPVALATRSRLWWYTLFLHSCWWIEGALIGKIKPVISWKMKANKLIQDVYRTWQIKKWKRHSSPYQPLVLHGLPRLIWPYEHYFCCWLLVLSINVWSWF